MFHSAVGLPVAIASRPHCMQGFVTAALPRMIVSNCSDVTPSTQYTQPNLESSRLRPMLRPEHPLCILLHRGHEGAETLADTPPMCAECCERQVRARAAYNPLVRHHSSICRRTPLLRTRTLRRLAPTAQWVSVLAPDTGAASGRHSPHPDVRGTGSRRSTPEARAALPPSSRSNAPRPLWRPRHSARAAQPAPRRRARPTSAADAPSFSWGPAQPRKTRASPLGHQDPAAYCQEARRPDRLPGGFTSSHCTRVHSTPARARPGDVRGPFAALWNPADAVGVLEAHQLPAALRGVAHACSMQSLPASQPRPHRRIECWRGLDGCTLQRR